MFKVSLYLVASMIACGSQVEAAPLKLRSDSKTITTKSRAIEAEYSKDMRETQKPTSAIDNQKALVIEEGESLYEGTPSTQKLESVSGSSADYYSAGPMTNSFAYPSTLKMREDRKAGVALAVGGALGAVGFNMELNFEEADGVLAGFGFGPGYNSFQVAWKHAFEGDFVAPYTTLGYSRWYNSRGRSSDFDQSDILDRILTDEEKNEGRFGTDFVNASFGVQYNQLVGDFAGLSFYGEVTAMYEVKRSILLPSGSVGSVYYF